MSVDISGYTYQAENLCSECTIVTLNGGKHINLGWTYDADNVIRFAGACMGIDIMKEDTFDSNDFPKPIFTWQLEDGEKCGKCNQEL